ncbi:MAG: TonB-dependent receptor, partial [Gammaproteobacteria bacterium]|nr:TonB-dependent receptor [Gammaproteobacteria bacterium]
ITDKFEEETSDAFEVGIRSTVLDGRLRLEAAYYHTDVDDMQFFEFFVGGFGLLRVVNTIDEVSITGGELALSVDVNDYLTLFGSMSVVNGRIDVNRSRPITVGNEVPYAPERTANLGLDFNIPIKNNIDFTARFDWSFVGDTWFHTIQDEVVPGLFSLGGFGPTDLSPHKRDNYSLMNLRAGMQGNNWSLIGFVNNLADTDYLEEVIPAPEFGGSFVHPGNTRTLGLELNVQFY